MKEVSIVIVCMNRPDNLYPCLNSICATTACSYETYVVAYKYNKTSLQEARERYPWVNFIESDEWRGFAENNNLALRLVTTPYVLVLNDDTIVSEGLIDGLLKDCKAINGSSEGNTETVKSGGIVSAPLYNEDGTLQFCGRPLLDTGQDSFTAWNYIKAAWHIYPKNTTLEDLKNSENTAGRTSEPNLYLCEVGSICGACFMIPTELFRSVGFFDERYFFTPEDIALCDTLRRKGHRIYIDPALSVIHKYHGSTSRLAHAIRPAEIRGCLIYLSRGSRLRYFLIGIAVWFAEAAKFMKATLTGNKSALRIYRNTLKSIFTHTLPKTLFLLANRSTRRDS